MTEFTLPELGENIASGDVVRVLVRAGDTLQRDQAVLELETDKATIEVPSSVSGVIKELRVNTGDKVKVGQVILVVDEESAAAPSPEPKATGPNVESARATAPVVDEAATEGGQATEAQVAPGSTDPADKRGREERWTRASGPRLLDPRLLRLKRKSRTRQRRRGPGPGGCWTSAPDVRPSRPLAGVYPLLRPRAVMRASWGSRWDKCRVPVRAGGSRWTT